MRRRGYDIRKRKQELRARYKAVRTEIEPRQRTRWDSAILKHLTALTAYQDCTTLLCYVPIPGEIDTVPVMEDAWSRGKQVAVPYCVPDTRIIEFYRIDSLDSLVEGAYGVREPDPDREVKLTGFMDSLCILPGLAFDAKGYRLGYGGGYYDRFLSGPYEGGQTVGLCYGICTVDRLARGAFDRSCDYLVTETGAKRIPRK